MAEHAEVPPRQAAKYPWDKYADGQTWKCVHGEDFTVQPRSFANAARKAAFFRGCYVSINLRGPAVYLRFHA